MIMLARLWTYAYDSDSWESTKAHPGHSSHELKRNVCQRHVRAYVWRYYRCKKCTRPFKEVFEEKGGCINLRRNKRT
jgi:hypothetical protein